MTPRFKRDIRRWTPIIAIFVVAIIGSFGYFYFTRTPTINVSSEPEPATQLVWKFVNTNNVLFWPVVGDQCVRENAYYQLHTDTKVLVIHEHDDGMVEVELEDQNMKYTHGCIHSSLLRD